MAYGATSEDVQRVIQFTGDRSKKLIPLELMKSWLTARIFRIGNKSPIYTTKEQPIYLGLPSNGAWYGRNDALPATNGKGPQVTSVWGNKLAVVPTTLDLISSLEEKGAPDRLWDQADIAAMEAAWSFRRLIASGMVNGAGGKQPEGLTYALEKLAPSAQVKTIGGINKATKAWWRNPYVQLTQNFGVIGAGTSIPAGLLALQALKDQCTLGANGPSDLVTRQATFRLAKRAFQEMSLHYNMIGDRTLAQFGFENIMFDGMYLSWDSNVPADTVLALHLQERIDFNQNGDPADKTVRDTDLEDLGGYGNLLEMNGSIGFSYNPNINFLNIPPRSPERLLQETSWQIHAINMLYPRLPENGIAGSDNGSRWETWL